MRSSAREPRSSQLEGDIDTGRWHDKACAEGAPPRSGDVTCGGSHVKTSMSISVKTSMSISTPSPGRRGVRVRAALRWDACDRAPAATGGLPTRRVSDGAMQRGQASSATPDLANVVTLPIAPQAKALGRFTPPRRCSPEPSRESTRVWLAPAPYREALPTRLCRTVALGTNPAAGPADTYVPAANTNESQKHNVIVSRVWLGVGSVAGVAGCW